MRALILAVLVLAFAGSVQADTPPDFPNGYSFTRELLPAGSWDVDHPDRKTLLGDQIHLADEIETALPGLTFQVLMEGSSLMVYFADPLSAGQQDTLAETVADHKSNALL